MTTPITVKPLVWRADVEANNWFAVYRSAWPYVIKKRGQYYYLNSHDLHEDWSRFASMSSPSFDTLEAAQAAAQEEWSAFIRAAIEPPLLAPHYQRRDATEIGPDDPPSYVRVAETPADLERLKEHYRRGGDVNAMPPPEQS